MPTDFETYVTTEIPKRSVMLTYSNTGYDGDPNASGAPTVVKGVNRGSFYLQLTGNVLWKKNSASPGTWEQVGVHGDFLPLTGGTLTGTLTLDSNIGLRISGGASKPAAGSSYRGMLWVTPGDTGIADKIEICMKNDDGTYLWAPLLPLAGGLNNLIF